MNRNLTILIAEDNEDDTFLFQRAFRTIGLKNPIQIVRDGQQVIRYLQGEAPYSDRKQFPFPSVIFLDLKMPRVNGFDVLQWLYDNSHYHVMPTMVFTGAAGPADVRRAYQLGANACLVKPRTLSELESVLQKALAFWSICVKPSLPENLASVPGLT